MTSRRVRPPLRLALGLLAGGLVARCDGTPLPEPPDNTPTPSFSAPELTRIGVQVPANAPVEMAGELLEVPLSGGAGAADPGAELWAIALDSPATPVARTRPRADGSFSLPALVARVGDRIRLVTRGPRGHSPALDLVVRAVDSTSRFGDVAPLPASPFPCLDVRPSDELSVPTSAAVTLTNGCADTLTVEPPSLRLDDGFALGDVPERLAPGEQAVLVVGNDAPRGLDERGDVLLFAVRDGAGTRARYALSIYAPPE